MTAYAAIIDAMTLYFDGLYHSDTARLAKCFIPQAQYVCATDGDADASRHGPVLSGRG